MYICKDCGETYTEETMPTYKDFTRLGENGFVDECSCGGEIVEANECIHCFELAAGAICEDCLEKGKTFNNALHYGKSNKEFVKINGYLAHEFTESEINIVLERELREAKRLGIETKHKEYLSFDTEHFADWLENQ